MSDYSLSHQSEDYLHHSSASPESSAYEFSGHQFSSRPDHSPHFSQSDDRFHRRVVDRGCDLSSRAAEEIKQLCRGCPDSCASTDCTQEHIKKVLCQTVHCDDTTNSGDRYQPDNFAFYSIITPLSNLKPLYSKTQGCVQFLMRRKNKTVTLQWEPFTGLIAANGVAYLTVVQSICNTPPYPLKIPIYLEYKGVGRQTHLAVNPHGKNGNLLFYLNTDGSSQQIMLGDSITIPGGAVSWIVE